MNQGFTDQKAHRIVRPINGGNAAENAQVVKLVDTPASGAGDLTVVEVRVFSWAPYSDQTRESGFFRFRGLKTFPAIVPSPALEKFYRLSLQ